MLGGIHFLFNRLVENMPFSCSLWMWKIVVLDRVSVYFWLDFGNEYTPKKACNALNLSMYEFAIKALHFSFGIWRSDKKRQNQVSGERRQSTRSRELR